MKLMLLTDRAGKILAAQVSMAAADLGVRSVTRMRPAAGEEVHEVDFPPDLHAHVLQGTWSREIFKYSAAHQAGVTRLVKRQSAP